MISKNSSWNRQISKMRPGVIMLTWVLAILYYVVGTLIVVISTKNNLQASHTNYAEFIERRYISESVHNLIGIGSIGSIIIAAFIGFVAALQVFHYLTKRQAIDFYHSLPVNKKRLFINMYLVGLRDYVIPIAAASALALLLALVMGAGTGALFVSILLGLLANVIVFAEVYAITTLAMMLSSNSFIAICLSSLFQVILFIPVFIVMLLHSAFNMTYYADSVDMLRLSALSPIGSLIMRIYFDNAVRPYNIAYVFNTDWTLKIFSDMIYPLIMLLVLALLVPFLSYILFYIRREEESSTLILFGPFRMVLKIFVAVCLALISGVAISYCFSDIMSIRAAIMSIFIMALTVLIVCCLAEALYHRDVRGSMSKIYHAAIAFCIAWVVFFAFRMDVLGYDSYVPKESRVVSAGLEVPLLSSYDTSIAYKDGGYLGRYIDTLDEMNLSDKETIKALIGICEESEKYMKDNRQTITEGDVSTLVHIRFTLDSGRTVTRTLNISDDIASRYLDSVFEDEAYISCVYPMPSSKEIASHMKHNGSTYMECDYDERTSLDPMDFEGFAKAYAEDLKDSYSYTLVKNEEPRGSLVLSFAGASADDDTIYSNFRKAYEIYPEYSRSIAYLNSLGVDLSGED